MSNFSSPRRALYFISPICFSSLINNEASSHSVNSFLLSVFLLLIVLVSFDGLIIESILFFTSHS